MFRLSSPWDGWASMRADEDDAYPFHPSHYGRSYGPSEDFGCDHSSSVGHPAYRASRRPHVTTATFVPVYSRHQPHRQQAFFPPARNLYDNMEALPYGFPYTRRTAVPSEAAFFPPGAHVPLRVVPHSEAHAYADADADVLVGEDEYGCPVLLHNGHGYKLRQPESKQQAAGTPQPMKSVPAGRKAPAPAPAADSASDDNGDDDDGGDDGRRTDEGAAASAPRGPQPQPQLQPHPVLFMDPWTGLYYRAVPPAAPAPATAPATAAAAAAGQTKFATGRVDRPRGSSSSAPSATKPNSGSQTAPAASAAALPVASSAASPPRSATPPKTTASAAASAPTIASASTGPTRIRVRAPNDAASASATVVPVRTSESKTASSATRAAGTAAAAAAFSLERQPSSALVPRPSMEVALSRGPSAVLPSVAATTATNSASAAANAASTASAAAAPVTEVASSRTRTARGKGPFAATSASVAAGPAAASFTPSRMTRSQAARTIQRWWRGWRLWRHTPALRQLQALGADLRSAASRYYGYMGATDGNITNKQKLEINELAMRAILKLDSLEGLPPELRALRKHLTGRALRLQDEVQTAYEKSGSRPSAPPPPPPHQQLQEEEEAPPTAAADGSVAAVAATESPTSQCNSAPVVSVLQGIGCVDGGRLSGRTRAVEPLPAAQEPAAQNTEGTPTPCPIATDVSAQAAGRPAAAEDSTTSTGVVAARAPSAGAVAGGDTQLSRSPSAAPPQQQHPSPAPHVHPHLHVSRRPRLAAWLPKPSTRRQQRLVCQQRTKSVLQEQQQQQQQQLAATTVAAGADCGRALQGIYKHVVTKRGGGGGSGGAGGARRGKWGQNAFKNGVELQRLQRRLTAAVAAVAAVPPSASMANGHAPVSAGDVRRHKRLSKWKRQPPPPRQQLLKQAQQQCAVVLRIVVQPGDDGEDAVDAQRYRTAVLVDSEVQTD